MFVTFIIIRHLFITCYFKQFNHDRHVFTSFPIIFNHIQSLFNIFQSFFQPFQLNFHQFQLHSVIFNIIFIIFNLIFIIFNSFFIIFQYLFFSFFCWYQLFLPLGFSCLHLGSPHPSNFKYEEMFSPKTYVPYMYLSFAPALK